MVYDAVQDLMGATRTRREVVSRFIRPSPDARILDLGCGTADILRYLPEGVEYWGFDISKEYIDAATRRFGARGKFHCAAPSADELSRLPKMDAVLAMGVLHHFDAREAEDLLLLARSALAVTGRVITIDPVFHPGQNPLARLLISMDRGRNVRTADEYRRLAAGVFRRVTGQLREQAWIPYTHWIMECSG